VIEVILVLTVANKLIAQSEQERLRRTLERCAEKNPIGGDARQTDFIRSEKERSIGTSDVIK
jgi:hypothetical protein